MVDLRRCSSVMLLVVLLAAILSACDSDVPATTTPPTPLVAPTPTSLPSTTLVVPTSPPTPMLVSTSPPLPPAPASISQTVNGYTVTLYPQVADVSHLVISYTVGTPQGVDSAITWLGQGWNDQWLYTGPHLSTDDGKSVDSYTKLPISPSSTQDQLGADYAHIVVFDTTALAQLPQVLHLKLTADLFVNDPPLNPFTIWPEPAAHSLVKGLSFEFSVPVYNWHRFLAVGQGANNKTLYLMLDSVLVTASTTRLEFHAPTTPKDMTVWVSKYHVQVGDSSAAVDCAQGDPRENLSIDPRADPHKLITSCAANLLSTTGDWTVTVDEVSVGAYDTVGLYPGPWTFHFTMPPATTESYP